MSVFTIYFMQVDTRDEQTHSYKVLHTSAICSILRILLCISDQTILRR